ncbi:MAG: DinB family protein [Dehalococcoidales bacterium]|nr:DinB family protein [Dehalococcoidales bacterium]
MEVKELIVRSLEQSQRYLTNALDGLTQEEAAWSPTPECNSIAFTLWHTVRVEDRNINRVIQNLTELYEAEGWQEKLGTPAQESGGRYTLEQLQAWPVPKLETTQEYAKSVREKTLAFLESVTPEKLAEVPSPERPSDSVAAILGRISTEIAMHVGQIAYLRGIKRGLNK